MFNNKSVLRSLSNISSNFSEVYLASLVLPVLTSVEKPKPLVLFFGIGMTFFWSYLSLLFAKYGKL